MIATVTEEWRPVVGWEGWYEVSSLGRVRRVMQTRGTRRGKVRRACPTKTGYLFVGLHMLGHVGYDYIHRLVARAFLGPINGGVVNHKNKDRSDNRAVNLEITTCGQNLAHAQLDVCPTCGRPFEEVSV